MSYRLSFIQSSAARRNFLCHAVVIFAFIWHSCQDRAAPDMPLSRNIVLLLCAGVVTITSIGMNSFSLFLRPIEAEFSWSRTTATVPYMFGMLGWEWAASSLVNWPTTLVRAGSFLQGLFSWRGVFSAWGFHKICGNCRSRTASWLV